MARKVGQIIGRAPRRWLMRVYVGVERKKRMYLNKTILTGMHDADAHRNARLSNREFGRPTRT